MDTQSRGSIAPPPPVANEEGSIEGTTADKVLPTVVVYEDHRSLFKATLEGRWKEVKEILRKNHETMRAKLMTVEQEAITVLDIAVIAGHDQLVENLAKLLDPKNDFLIYKRALCNAARGGRIRMVKALVNKIKGEADNVGDALSTAISWAPMQKDVILYLANHAPPRNDNIMSSLIMSGHLDIAYHLQLKNQESVATEDTEHARSLGYVVSTTSYLVSMMAYFRGRTRLNFWEKSIHRCIPQCLVYKSFGNSNAMKMAQVPFIKRIAESKLRQEWIVKYGKQALIKKLTSMKAPEVLEFLLTSGIVLDAASSGITEFVKLCLQHFPELMWEKNFTKELIKEVVKGRHVELFRLVNTYNTTPYLTDEGMKAVVEWSPSFISTDVSGAAFLTQRELQWFKVVEDRSDPSIKSQKFKVRKVVDESDPSFKSLQLEVTEGRIGKTLWEVFVDQRQGLLKEAGQWMKNTSSSCSLVATLIITVAFAAAFTIPGDNHDTDGVLGGNHNNTGVHGGNHNNTDIPRGSVIVFVIADALALFSSVTATMMFLAILTSRYAIEDFLYSLPRKMILGLTFLFLSLAFMMMAFGSALTIFLNKRWERVYIPITLLGAIPVLLSAILQLPLYAEMIESTYWPPLYRPKKIWK